MTDGSESRPAVSAAALRDAIRAADFSAGAATLVGFGHMGRQYVKALLALGVRRVHVCSRTAAPLGELEGLPGVTVSTGGFARLERAPDPEEVAIVATPTDALVAAADHVTTLGYRHLLVEKPVSLWSCEVERLAATLEGRGVDAVCAYNRVAYPALLEAEARARAEGGITSCVYTFTEMIRADWPQRFPASELARWGIANSGHVLSMAHRLIGLPASWHAQRRGELPWHPTGAVFVGSGVSDDGVPFAYHADWGSTGRWSVEIHTRVSSYRLCPLERLFRRTNPLGGWEEVPLAVFSPEIKAGFLEQVAAALSPGVRELVPLIALRRAVALTRYAEGVFGYPATREGEAAG